MVRSVSFVADSPVSRETLLARKTCRRCKGEGRIIYRRVDDAGKEWATTRDCPVCLGLGVYTPSKRRHLQGPGFQGVWFHSKATQHMSMDEIMDRLEDSGESQ